MADELSTRNRWVVKYQLFDPPTGLIILSFDPHECTLCCHSDLDFLFLVFFALELFILSHFLLFSFHHSYFLETEDGVIIAQICILNFEERYEMQPVCFITGK